MITYFWAFIAVLFGLLVYSLSAVFLPIVAGMLGAYMLNPLTQKLERLRLDRAGATTLTMLFFITIIATFFMLFIPHMHRELLAISRNLPTFSERLLEQATPIIEKLSADFGTPTVDQIKIQIADHIGDIAQVIINFLISVISSGMVLANLISLLVLTPIVMFYFLKDWPLFLSAIDKMVPRRWHKMVKRYTLTVHKTLGAYARGQATVCLTLIIVYSLILSLIKLPDALFIGFLTGFLAFIPYLGWLIGLLLSIVVSLIHFVGMWQIFAILSIFIALALIEGYVLTPRFVGQRVGLHPIWIIFALLAFGNWFGFMGVIIALPVSAIISAVVRLVLEEYFKSPIYLGKSPVKSSSSSIRSESKEN